MVTVVLWYQEHESLKAEDSIEQADQWCSALYPSGPAEPGGQEGTFDPLDLCQIISKISSIETKRMNGCPPEISRSSVGSAPRMTSSHWAQNFEG